MFLGCWILVSRRANIQQVCFAAVTQTAEKQHLRSTPTLGGATRVKLVSSEGCFSGRGKQDGEGSVAVAGMNRLSPWTYDANYRPGFPRPVFKAAFWSIESGKGDGNGKIWGVRGEIISFTKHFLGFFFFVFTLAQISFFFT